MKNKKLYQAVFEQNGAILHGQESAKLPILQEGQTLLGVFVQEIKVSSEPIRYESDHWDETPVFKYERIGSRVMIPAHKAYTLT